MNNHLPLNKTNYYANLKKKAKNVKDTKEQIKVNEELLNCIDILCNRYEHLLKEHKELSEKYNKFAEAIGIYVNQMIVPRINELTDTVSKLSEDYEDPEGGETMNA